MTAVARPLLWFKLDRDLASAAWASLNAIDARIKVYPLESRDRWATVKLPVDVLPAFEQWVAAQPPGCVVWVNGGDAGYSPLGYFRDGRVVGIRPSTSPAVPVTDPPHHEALCPTCEHRVWVRRPEARPVVRFPRKPTSHFFLVDHLSTFASERFLDAVAEKGLDAGLTAHPLHEVHGSADRWFWLSGRKLQEPPPPFIRWVPDCPTCGVVRHRYRWCKSYLPFNDGPVHWMDPAPYITVYEPIVVSVEVFQWLEGPGARFLSPYQREKVFNRRSPGYPAAFGLYPRHAVTSYYPLAWHAPDTIVEDPTILPLMTHDDLYLPPSPPEPKPADPKWYTDALDKGKFTDLDRALAWEQDIVYLLHLVKQDLGGTLSDDDIACFPNLNELVLRGTPIDRVPDAVFGLRNLRRLDLRDTGLPADEIARVRSRLRKGVKLQVSKPPPA